MSRIPNSSCLSYLPHRGLVTGISKHEVSSLDNKASNQSVSMYKHDVRILLLLTNVGTRNNDVSRGHLKRKSETSLNQDQASKAARS